MMSRDMLTGMHYRMTALGRAFQLARSGQPNRIKDIVTALRREGYSTEQIAGPALKRQLLNLSKQRVLRRRPPIRQPRIWKLRRPAHARGFEG